MALTEVQLTTLFLGSFGQSPGELGFEIDASGPEPVAKKGNRALSLLVIDGKAMEWQINGKRLITFTLNGKDARSAARKTEALAALNAALA
jgi:hypothetical protein